jgi:hypothetical protein
MAGIAGCLLQTIFEERYKFSQYDGRGTPDLVLLDIEIGYAEGSVAQKPVLDYHATFIEKKAERYLQDFRHLLWLRPEQGAVRQIGDEGMDAEIARRYIKWRKSTEDTDVVATDPDLFASFSHGSKGEGLVALFKTASWEADLSCMGRKVRGALSEDHIEIAVGRAGIDEHENTALVG